MSKYIPGNQKHLTLNDRIYIEESLEQGRSFKDIARYLCKDPTTISKEVKAHRIHEPHFKERLFYNARNFCVHRFTCKKTNACRKIELCGVKCASCPTCNKTCPDFEREHCSHLQRAPYVCNGCGEDTVKCTIASRYRYNARIADREYKDTQGPVSALQNMSWQKRIRSVHPSYFRARHPIRSSRTTRNLICRYGHFTPTSIWGS